MKKCKNQLLAALIASTMAMSMTACSGTSAETTKPSETAATEKATETESGSETAEAKEYDLDDVKDYVEGIDDYKIYIKDADKLEQKDLFKQMKELVLEKAKGDGHVVKSVDVDLKESSDKDEKAKDIYEMTYTITVDAAELAEHAGEEYNGDGSDVVIKVVFKAQLVSEKEAAKLVKAKKVVLGYEAKEETVSSDTKKDNAVASNKTNSNSSNKNNTGNSSNSSNKGHSSSGNGSSHKNNSGSNGSSGNGNSGSNKNNGSNKDNKDNNNKDNNKNNSGNNGQNNNQKPEKHTHKYVETITKQATCTEDGEKLHKCACGKSYTTIIIATGHKYDNGTVVKEATCTEKGQKAYKCSKCNEVKLEDIAATGHKYG